MLCFAVRPDPGPPLFTLFDNPLVTKDVHSPGIDKSADFGFPLVEKGGLTDDDGDGIAFERLVGDFS